MTGGFPIVPLGRVALPVERPEVPAAGTVYRQIGVKLWGGGAYERGSIDGSQTRYKTLSRVEADDIIVNKIWARNGSVAVVPEGLSGCYASSEFPTFAPIPEKLDSRWFHWLTRTKTFWEQCDEKSRGTSGKNRIRPELFLEIGIPLPPLSEQRRIVARIEELAAKIDEARNLRRQSVQEADALARSVTHQILRSSGEYREVPLESVCADIIDNLHSNPVYAEEGVPCVRSPDVGWGELWLDKTLRTSEEEYIRRTGRGEPQPDDIVLVREGGGTGKAAIVKEGQRFSLGQRVMLLRPDKNLVQPKFLLQQLLSPAIHEEQVVPLLKGSASPHLNIGVLRKLRFLLPSLSEQARIVIYLDSIRARIDALTCIQAETAAELDALLPSILDKAFKGKL